MKGKSLLSIGVALFILLGTLGCRTTQEVSSPTPRAAETLGAPQKTLITEPDPFLSQRLSMVRYQIEARGIDDPRILEAMSTIPRHEFVPPDKLDQAYVDHAVPIGYGQTISQPYIQALMTQILDIERGNRVLEVGTGSGYQAALLAELTDEVYSVEIIPELAEAAAQRLKRLGYTNIKTANLDGYYGWEAYAPFDAIIVTCAPDHVPPPLLEQLVDGGRLVIPVGPPGFYQTLWKITRQGDEFIYENWGGVTFVPLTGEH